MSQSGRKRLDLSALLQHEKSNDIALDCPTTKPHTVVCRLYGARRRISSSFHATAAALWARDEAQRAAIERFAAAESLLITAEYSEFETGKGADALDRRPQLAAALAAARKAKCRIAVSTLDRLFPGVAFV